MRKKTWATGVLISGRGGRRPGDGGGVPAASAATRPAASATALKPPPVTILS